MKQIPFSRRIGALLLSILMLIGAFSLTSCEEMLSDILDVAIDVLEEESSDPTSENPSPIDEDGQYTTKEDVALYLWTYHRLPSNFITKSQARNLGWESGSVEKYAPGYAIGGDRFGNYEGRLPKGKTYIECDIDTVGKSSRGACRIVYATDFSVIYYTADHYESFEIVYGGES
jgi:hypothetical protein